MLKIPHCLDSRLTDGGKVVSPTHRPRLTSQKYYLYASGTHCYKPQGLVWLEVIGKQNKINSPYRVSKPRPSGLQHSVLTTTLQRAPPLQLVSSETDMKISCTVFDCKEKSIYMRIYLVCLLRPSFKFSEGEGSLYFV
jgi:hypothetical protein